MYKQLNNITMNRSIIALAIKNNGNLSTGKVFFPLFAVCAVPNESIRLVI